MLLCNAANDRVYHYTRARCSRYVTQFATRKRSDSYTIKIQRGVEKKMEVIEGLGEQRISLQSQFAIPFRALLVFFSLFFLFLYTRPTSFAPTFVPSLFLHRCFLCIAIFPTPSYALSPRLSGRVQCSNATVHMSHEMHRR